MPEFVKYLNADMAMVVVTIVVVQLIKGLLPSPIPSPDQPIRKLRVIEQLRWVPLICAFVVGTALAILLDKDQLALIPKIRSGLQTGAYAVAAWEVYSATIRPTVERVLGAK